jgi:phosphatidylglycerol:prolipoprotein diacylglycerol transferase
VRPVLLALRRVHPILFTIPGVNAPVHTYGVLIVTGFLMAMYVAYREAKHQGQYTEFVVSFAIWALAGGILGARLVFIIVGWRHYFIEHPIDHVAGFPIPSVLVLWKGGLVFYGAAIGGVAAYFWHAWRNGITGSERLRLADIIIVGVPLAHMFGRLGCVAAGCCWGDAAAHLDAAGDVVSTFPLGMRFPESALAFQGLRKIVDPETRAWMMEQGTTLPLIPIQLMESFGEGCIYLTLLVVRSRKWFHGQALLTYGILYPILRSITETMRGDAGRGYVIPGALSTSQFISLIVAAAALITIFVLRRRGIVRIARA